VTFDNFNHGFFDFIVITICSGQEAVNVFAVSCNHKKFVFLFTQVSFRAGPEAEKKFKMPCEP